MNIFKVVQEVQRTLQPLQDFKPEFVLQFAEFYFDDMVVEEEHQSEYTEKTSPIEYAGTVHAVICLEQNMALARANNIEYNTIRDEYMAENVKQIAETESMMVAAIILSVPQIHWQHNLGAKVPRNGRVEPESPLGQTVYNPMKMGSLGEAYGWYMKL